MNIYIVKIKQMKNKSKFILTTEEIEERQKIFDVYYNFNEYLNLLGFRVATTKKV